MLQAANRTLLTSVLALAMGAVGALLVTQLPGLVSAEADDSNVIHSCVWQSDVQTGDPNVSFLLTLFSEGRLRIVGSNDNCLPGETALDWSKTPGFTDYEVVTSYASVDFDTGVHVLQSVAAKCPAGKKVLGGGGSQNVISGDVNLWQSVPGSSLGNTLWDLWQVSFNYTGASSISAVSLAAYAICANVGS